MPSRPVTIAAALLAVAMSVAVPEIQKLEGVRLKPYKDITGVLTVCSGSTDVVVQKVYTPEECTKLTTVDAQKAAEGILRQSPQLIYHPMQLAAAISFSYNVGVGAYDKSSVARDFNRGDYQQGCNDLLKYTDAGGHFSQGILNRRREEYRVCTSTLTPKGLTNVPPATTASK